MKTFSSRIAAMIDGGGKIRSRIAPFRADPPVRPALPRHHGVGTVVTGPGSYHCLERGMQLVAMGSIGQLERFDRLSEDE